MTLFETDRALLDAFRRGDAQALERVYSRYFDDVYRHLRLGFPLANGRRGPGLPDDRALDLLQDVFVRAFSERARVQYDGLRPYRPYLLRIARNLWVDSMRKQGHEVTVPDIDLLHDESSPDADQPEAGPAYASLHQATRAYLDTLDGESRAYIEARFEREQSQADVAVQLGVTRRRVRTLEERVERGLRRFLQRRGVKLP